MNANKGNKGRIRFLLIVFAGTLFSVLLHQIHHDPLMTVATRAKSIVITSGYFPPVAFAGLFAAFWIMGRMFLAIQAALRGTRYRKGAVFGLALGGMYLVGMIEAYVVYPVPLPGELFTGMADGSGILLMSILLGKYLAEDMPAGRKPARASPAGVLPIPLAFILFRYFAYTVIRIESSIATRPLATFLWTAGMGGWIGVMYMAAGRNLCPERPFRQALRFGGLLFGLNWLVYNLFTVLFIQCSVADLVLRCLIDSLAIVAGAYLSAALSQKTAGAMKREVKNTGSSSQLSAGSLDRTRRLMLTWCVATRCSTQPHSGYRYQRLCRNC